jgi:hypothetical protein
VSKIVIAPYSERKQQDRQERRNVFSDETNLYLLRLLRGESHRGANAAPLLRSADLQLELAAAIRQRLLPWFWSISLHIAVLLLLLYFTLSVIHFEPIEIMFGTVNFPAQPDEPVHIPGHANGIAPGVDGDQNGAKEIDEPTIPQVQVHPSPGLNFAGRDFSLRAEMLGSGGGSKQTDEAVLAGLRWLVRVQQPNGAWHFSGTTFPQSAAKDREDALAATAMALLAFQGFGVTPDSREPFFEEFVRPVRRGWDWLHKQQMPDGSFFQPSTTKDNHRFYTHAFCTIALCELLAMTGDETLREPAQRAIDYCIQHQSFPSGGWRYAPDRWSDQSDVSVTGWVVLALKSGQAAGLTIPPEVYNNAMKFFDSMMSRSMGGANQYQYRESEPEPRMAMTAEALLCRILLGWKRDNPRLAAGVQLIINSPPSFSEYYQRDVYYWFFATQTLFHYGGNEWQTWNSTMRDELLRNQENDGTERGSWNPERNAQGIPVRDAWGHQYGRLYTTCMSLYILEVYYRHLRVFPQAE